MLAQQVLAVVVAVGRAHHRMDVLSNWDIGTRVWQRDRALVVELDDDDWTLNPEEEQVVRAE